MKYAPIVAVGVAMLTVQQPAKAQSVICNTFGSMQTCNGPNGYNSMQNTFGSMTTGHDSAGNNWTTNRFGDQTTTTFQPNFRRGW